MGCGNIIRFWIDPWISSTPLGSRFPRLFNLSDLKEVVLGFFSSPSDWNLHLWRNHRDPKIQEYAELSAILQQFQALVTRNDSRIWTISPSGIFSVSSFFSTISSNPVGPPFPYNPIWFSLSPSKVQEFLWKIAMWPYLDVSNPFTVTSPSYLTLPPSAF